MLNRTEAQNLLRRALDSTTAEFRPGQWEAIDALVNRRQKLLVVERTGWGKSLVYFIATHILRDRRVGLTLIISPLLALMRNQIEAAQRLGISALTINSTNQDEWPALMQSIQKDEVDALLISPERLANDEFINTVFANIAGRIGLLVVDEAHCISDWGHDFRPDYRRLRHVLQRMPANMRILATTATANQRVIDDILGQVADIQVQRGPLMRESLALQTLRLPDQAARLAWLAEQLPKLPGTGIVYTLTTRDADQVATWLNQNQISARAYYSDVQAEGFADANMYRQHLEEMLLKNQLKVLVATTALGMGYDKPDLGFVVHYQAPASIVAYYQQVGRAGRAISYAIGVLMAGREDGEIQAYFRNNAFPDERHVQVILSLLADSDGLTTREIEGKVNLRRGQIEKVLKFLSVDNPSPVIKDNSKWLRTPVDYRLDHEQIARLTRQRVVEWEEVQGYVDTQDCLMVYLAQALDDGNLQPCGKCERCLGHPLVATSFSHQWAVNAVRYLQHSELPLACKKRIAPDAFATYGFKGNLPLELRAETGRILSRWGDAGWGQMVADDKHTGRFRDELVEAVVEMVRKRWNPEPFPTWVTCIPSHHHPTLVPDFSERLAQKLRLPFVPAVSKVRQNQPQKLQQNSFYQCRNLDGVFAIAAAIPSGPVLLVDDMVDSAWTLTVVAALLRRAGSGPVWPVALATTSNGE